MRTPRVIAAAVVLTAMAAPASAQRPQRLGDPIATFAEPFSNITGLRELSDGRVLLADQLERHVSFIDFASGDVQQIGREGQGPGEYATPSGLIPLPNDQSLLVDFGNMRLTRVEANGRLTDTWPMMRGDGTFIRPAGSDQQGRLYFSTAGVMIMRRGGDGGVAEPSDSAAVQRWDPTTDVVDTVGMVKTPQTSVTTRPMSSGGMSFSGAMMQPFASADAWGVAPDGRVAIARSAPYRLDWFHGSDATQGAPVDYQPIRITQAEKEAWADRQAEQGATMRIRGTDGNRSQSFQMPRPNIDEIEFPEFKPPFEGRSIRITPWSEVWVERTTAHDATSIQYDVFDSQGRRVKQIQLPEGRELVGFGREAVYVVRTDADDLQWLEKYEYRPQ
jgi:hypothetical protein